MVIGIAVGLYRKETNIKKALSAFLAVILVMSFTGCSNPSSESLSQDEQNTAVATDVTQEVADAAEPLSIPVAMSVGDVDLEKGNGLSDRHRCMQRAYRLDTYQRQYGFNNGVCHGTNITRTYRNCKGNVYDDWRIAPT